MVEVIIAHPYLTVLAIAIVCDSIKEIVRYILNYKLGRKSKGQVKLYIGEKIGECNTKSKKRFP